MIKLFSGKSATGVENNNRQKNWHKNFNLQNLYAINKRKKFGIEKCMKNISGISFHN